MRARGFCQEPRLPGARAIHGFDSDGFSDLPARRAFHRGLAFRLDACSDDRKGGHSIAV
jgi:hypothetical protein